MLATTGVSRGFGASILAYVDLTPPRRFPDELPRVMSARPWIGLHYQYHKLLRNIRCR